MNTRITITDFVIDAIRSFILFVLVCYLVKLCWDYTVPTLFNGPTITFMQAAALRLGVRLLTRSLDTRDS